MPKFRKKPVVIEAMQVTPIAEAALRCFMGASWTGTTSSAKNGLMTIDVQTLEGTMTAHVGDWIIKGVKGEFYPCKDDIFRMTYDEVSE